MSAVHGTTKGIAVFWCTVATGNGTWKLAAIISSSPYHHCSRSRQHSAFSAVVMNVLSEPSCVSLFKTQRNMLNSKTHKTPAHLIPAFLSQPCSVLSHFFN